jgi:hypothetical protein
MEYIFFKTDSKEWGDLWDFVRTHPINEGVEEPCTALHKNKEWQYLGGFKNGNIVISEVRHECHPNTNLPYKITYQHESFSKESIDKSSRII